MALNVIHAAAKVSSQSDQQRTNCAVGLHWLRSDWPRPCKNSKNWEATRMNFLNSTKIKSTRQSSSTWTRFGRTFILSSSRVAAFLHSQDPKATWASG